MDPKKKPNKEAARRGSRTEAKAYFEVVIVYHGTRIREFDIRYAFTPHDDPRRFDRLVYTRKEPDALKDVLATYGRREWILFGVSFYGRKEPETTAELSFTITVYQDSHPVRMWHYDPEKYGNALGAHIVYAEEDE